MESWLETWTHLDVLWWWWQCQTNLQTGLWASGNPSSFKWLLEVASVAGKNAKNAKSSIIKADRPVTTTCHYGKTYVLQLVKKKASLRSLWSQGYCCDHVFNGSGGLVERWSSNKVVLRTASSAVSLKMQHQKCCLQGKSITFCKKGSALNHNFDWECKPRPFQVHVALYQVVLSLS